MINFYGLLKSEILWGRLSAPQKFKLYECEFKMSIWKGGSICHCTLCLFTATLLVAPLEADWRQETKFIVALICDPKRVAHVFHR